MDLEGYVLAGAAALVAVNLATFVLAGLRVRRRAVNLPAGPRFR